MLWASGPLLLNNKPGARQTGAMKQITSYVLAAGLVMLAGAADAACYADYKAKKDGPLRLHYGVVQLSGACSVGAAAAELPGRIGRDGWTLLTVVSVFDASGLGGRAASAGQYYLRY